MRYSNLPGSSGESERPLSLGGRRAERKRASESCVDPCPSSRTWSAVTDASHSRPLTLGSPCSTSPVLNGVGFASVSRQQLVYVFLKFRDQLCYFKSVIG